MISQNEQAAALHSSTSLQFIDVHDLKMFVNIRQLIQDQLSLQKPSTHQPRKVEKINRLEKIKRRHEIIFEDTNVYLAERQDSR